MSMKKFLQIPLLLVALFLSSIPISAHDFEVGGIYYNILNETAKTVKVTYKGDRYNSYSNEYTGSVTIPSSVTYNGTTYSVSKIGSSAFYDCIGLTSITIPNSVTLIGDGAFYGCTNLTSISIPNSVTEIGSSAFEDCYGLTSITIPNSVTQIAYGAFSGCTGLTSVTIPNSVTEIGSSAFSGCTGLTSVTIPNSVTQIAYGAFGYCTGLTTVNFNAENCTLMDLVFKSCTNIKTINIGDSVKTIPNYMFYDCIGLTSITIPNSVTLIGDMAFYDCTNLTSISIPNSVTEIGAYAFHYTRWYNHQPDGVIYINNILYSYKGTMPNNTSININEGTISISSSAFSGCTGLTSVTIPNSVTEIGNGAFYGCTNLTSISIPNSVTEIGEYTFYGCTKLVSEPIFSKISQTTATVELSTSSNCPPYLLCNNKFYKNGDKITGLAPDSYHNYAYGLEINGNYCQINTNSPTFKTSPIYLYLNGTANVTSIIANGTHSIGDATFVSEGLDLNASGSFDNRNEKIFYNLDPNTSYDVYYSLSIKENTSPYSISKSFTTGDLDLTTQEAKPTSTTSVRLLASTNCDATEGTGFEWRRYDAPAELPSSKVTCPVVDGVLVGSLRGVKDDVYYKYRPYYTSSSGKTYYGDWIAFFTGDANVYFEPEVRTYDDIQVIQNLAVVKGYALEGTDVITAQGFEYWKTGTAIKPSSTDDRMTVNASGISMSATLANLEYNSTYKYRAFVTTAKGTVYGDEMEFSTGDDPAGIGYIEMDSDEFAVTLRENPVTGTAWVKIAGAAGEEVQYTITSMSGAMIATGSVILDGEWNAIDLNCPSGMYLLTINDSTQIKTLRLIVK